MPFRKLGARHIETPYGKVCGEWADCFIRQWAFLPQVYTVDVFCVCVAATLTYIMLYIYWFGWVISSIQFPGNDKKPQRMDIDWYENLLMQNTFLFTEN